MVKVCGKNIYTGACKRKELHIPVADAVIVTVPLTILCHIGIDLSNEKRIAIADIHYGAATKILLQGGFSKTDLPIDQLHYPSRNDPPEPNERGLIVCYTWGQDALVFGAKQEANAIDHAVLQVTEIHREMADQFEVGKVQAWFSDESAQGAYASLKPFQYTDNLRELMTPNHPIYLAGEAISFTNGWIQGALESGLNAAYHLYCHDHM